MAYKSAWYNENVMVDIVTGNIKCPLANNNVLNKVVVQDVDNKFYYRDAGSFGGGPEGPIGPAGPAGPTGPTGPAGAGTGDVIGPLSSTNRALTLFNGTSGKLIMNSGITTDTTAQGLVFSNSSLTSSDDQLDYYELNEFTMDFQSTGGGGVVLSAVPMRIFRMGKLVMCEIGTKSGNQVNTGVLQSTTPLSSRYLPQNQTTLYGVSALTDGAQVMGALNITASGFLQIAPLSSGSVVSLGVFSGSGGVGTKINGTWQNSHVSWMLA